MMPGVGVERVFVWVVLVAQWLEFYGFAGICPRNRSLATGDASVYLVGGCGRHAEKSTHLTSISYLFGGHRRGPQIMIQYQDYTSLSALSQKSHICVKVLIPNTTYLVCFKDYAPKYTQLVEIAKT